ncbi:MAG: SCO family protein [Candidatus Methylacidiphilales bacterium]|nr:SCO family protein [Candidatus Methylacidiphilales bacterium]
MSSPNKAPSILIPVIGMILFTFLAAFMAAYLTFSKGQGGNSFAVSGGYGTQSDMTEKFPLPEFTFNTSAGTKLTKQEMLGKVWAVDFIFTRCGGPCPAITRNFVAFQALIPGGPNFRMLTITVDPENDTPAVLAEYAKNFGANPEKWTFISGPKKELYDFITTGFKVVAMENATDPNASIDDKFLHSTKVALVDKQGNVRGYYEGSATEAAEWQKLRNDMLRLSAE